MIDIIHLKKNIIGQLIMHNIIALKYHVGVIFNDISSCPASLTPFYMGSGFNLPNKFLKFYCSF